MSSGRPVRGAAVAAAAYIQSEMVKIESSANTEATNQETTTTAGTTTTTTNGATQAKPNGEPMNMRAVRSSMPPPSDDEAMPDVSGSVSGGSSEDEMDADEALGEDDDNASPVPPSAANADSDLWQREDNTLTVEELRRKYWRPEVAAAATAADGPAAASEEAEEESSAERRARRRAKKQAKKEKRRRERHQAEEKEGTEEEESDGEAEPRQQPQPPADADESDADDASFHEGDASEDDEDEEDDLPPPLPALKSSRVGDRYQSELPRLLTPEEQAAERALLAAQGGSPLEGTPNHSVYIAPIETPEAHQRRMNELAERQRMIKQLQEEREARRLAAIEARAVEEREERERRRKKEAARARRHAEEEAAAAAAAAAVGRASELGAEVDELRHPHKRHRVDGGVGAPVSAPGVALLPDDLPQSLVHGHIVQSFPSAAPAHGHHHARYKAHYVSLFQADSDATLVGIAFDRREVEAVLQERKITFKQFLQEKMKIV